MDINNNKKALIFTNKLFIIYKLVFSNQKYINIFIVNSKLQMKNDNGHFTSISGIYNSISLWVKDKANTILLKPQFVDVYSIKIRPHKGRDHDTPSFT